MLSVTVTIVGAQPNPPTTRERVLAGVVDANDNVVARVNTKLEPPEIMFTEIMLTDPYVSEPIAPADTRGLPLASAIDQYTAIPREMPRALPLPGRERTAHTPRVYDPVAQTAPDEGNMPVPITNWEGISSTGPIPPDTDGQVGPDHYVQIVNSSGGAQVRVWDKTGTQLYNFDLASFWPTNDPCRSDASGDPVVLYDQLAGRWLLTQFALPDPPYYECIAVSKTGVPTNDPNDWWLYSFLVHNTKMNDYPKLGIWPDGYYMSVNQFTPGWAGAGAYVFDRAAMLTGADATFQYFDLCDLDSNYGGLLPSNLMGDTLPPTGAPNYFMSVDMDWSGADDVLHIFEFHTDWDTPANSTFGLASDLIVASFDWNICASGGLYNCIDQPDGAPLLDAIADRLMMHLWYRNFGDHESLVVNHTVNAGSDRAGIRWYEIRGGAVDTTLADATIYQQGDYAPDDTEHRWMGSVAMDCVGNMSLGYSVSSVNVYPSIRYAGRQADDPLGALPQTEVEIIAGSGSQTHSAARWGDYSAMSVDPVNDCTFWYTQEYVETTGLRSWQTRVASFKFPNCLSQSKGILTGVVSDSVTLAPIAGVTIQATTDLTGSYQTTTGADGAYTMLLLADTYTVTASTCGYQPATISPVNVFSGATTTQGIVLTPTAMYDVEGAVTDDTTGWPLYAHITVRGDPLNPPAPYDDFWTDPATGYYSVTLSEDITYTFEVEAWSSGYGAASRDVGPLTVDVTENFTLTANLATCIAPGYQMNVQSGIFERFENDGAAPPGWTVVNNAGTGDVWAFNNPGGRENLTGGNGGFAIVDSDFYGLSSLDTELRTASLDFSGVPSVVLAFDTDYWTRHGLDAADVDVSANGGITWTNVWTKTGSSYRGPIHEVVDISTLAGGESDVIVRFHYHDASYEWWWQVDNVLVGAATCDPLPGGLVVGNVYDGDTGDGLLGAEVANDGGYVATTEATPNDPAVDDGFYTLFSPAGTHAFTGTMVHYRSDVANVTVVLSDVVRQDFSLTPRPEPTWEKLVYVNDVLTDIFPATVVASDTIKIADRVWFTYTGNVTFTLTEEWTESLNLATYTVRALPGGTVVVPGYGTAIPAASMWVVSVTDAHADWVYVITKTFNVLDVGGGTDVITETLWVDAAYPQLAPRVLEFVLQRNIYLPIVVRNY